MSKRKSQVMVTMDVSLFKQFLRLSKPEKDILNLLIKPNINTIFQAISGKEIATKLKTSVKKTIPLVKRLAMKDFLAMDLNHDKDMSVANFYKYYIPSNVMAISEEFA